MKKWNQAEWARELGHRNRTHGLAKTHVYRCWEAMKRRCNGKSMDACYASISMCVEWSSFDVFLNAVRGGME